MEALLGLLPIHIIGKATSDYTQCEEDEQRINLFNGVVYQMIELCHEVAKEEGEKKIVQDLAGDLYKASKNEMLSALICQTFYGVLSDDNFYFFGEIILGSDSSVPEFLQKIPKIKHIPVSKYWNDESEHRMSDEHKEKLMGLLQYASVFCIRIHLEASELMSIIGQMNPGQTRMIKQTAASICKMSGKKPELDLDMD